MTERILLLGPLGTFMKTDQDIQLQSEPEYLMKDLHHVVFPDHHIIKIEISNNKNSSYVWKLKRQLVSNLRV